MATGTRTGGRTSATWVAVYCRVSSAGQEDNSSLRTQEERCRAYAAEHDWEVAEVYREVHTGTELFERPQLTLLREAMRRREFDVLLVHALDRLSRKQTHQGLILSEAEHSGVGWDSATEDIDDSPQGQVLRAVIGGMAEMERLKILERTQRGTRARATAGKLLAGPRPLFGYRWRGEDKGAYDFDPTTSAVVRRIYDEFLGGRSLRAICLRLTAEGVPTPIGKKLEWSVPTVSDILKNPTYAGVATAFRYQTHRMSGASPRVTVRPDADQMALPPGTVPAIVTGGEHAAAVDRLEYNRATSPRNNRDPDGTLLRAGFIRCGHCGRSMGVKNPCSPRQRVPMYRCNGTHPDLSGNRGVHIQAPSLDAAVWGRVADVLLRPEVIKAEVERRRSGSTAVADLGAIDRRLAVIDRQRQNLVRAIALLEGDPDSAALMARELSGLSAQRKEIETERATKVSLHADETAENGRLADLAEWCARTASNLERLTYAERRMVLEALGVAVQVWPTDHQPRWEVAMAPLPISSGGAIESRTARG